MGLQDFSGIEFAIMGLSCNSGIGLFDSGIADP